jgi:hypothetical protein
MSTIIEASTSLLYQLQMMKDSDECGVVGGMLGRGNQCVWRKPASAPLCPLQIPHDLTWAIVVGSQQLTISKANPD